MRIPKCGKCGASFPEIVDGAVIGGMPGINYQNCRACGWNRAITKRPRKERLK